MQINHSNNTGIHVDWTVNITTLGAIILMLCGWAVQVALQGSRISAVEAQNVQQAIANEKLAATVQRLDSTLTRLLTQVEERQRQADLRADRSDFRQDKAELHNQR